MNNLIYSITSSDAILLFLSWLAAQGLGVKTQWIFSNIKIFDNRLARSRRPNDTAEWLTEGIFIIVSSAHFLLFCLHAEFRESIMYLWQEHSILMLGILIVGWLLEFFPSIEQRWNKFSGHGAVWIALIVIFSVITS